MKDQSGLQCIPQKCVELPEMYKNGLKIHTPLLGHSGSQPFN